VAWPVDFPSETEAAYEFSKQYLQKFSIVIDNPWQKQMAHLPKVFYFYTGKISKLHSKARKSLIP
jgi:hypothetical protein